MDGTLDLQHTYFPLDPAVITKVHSYNQKSVEIKDFAEVEAYTLVPVDEADPAGQVASATLRIRAPTSEMDFRMVGIRLWRQGWNRLETLILDTSPQQHKDIGIMVFMDNLDNILKMGEKLPSVFLFKAGHELYGLLFQKLQSDEGELYERVGCFWITVLSDELKSDIAQRDRKLITLV